MTGHDDAVAVTRSLRGVLADEGFTETKVELSYGANQVTPGGKVLCSSPMRA